MHTIVFIYMFVTYLSPRLMLHACGICITVHELSFKLMKSGLKRAGHMSALDKICFIH